MEETLSSLQNPRVKNAVKLRQRREREKQGRFLIEGYRELKRAVESGLRIDELFICPQNYLGTNEDALVERAVADSGARLFPCTESVFAKLSFRDRPDGLLAVAPTPTWGLDRLEAADPAEENGATKRAPLYVVAVTIEKPGNLGTILRTADAVGADGVIVCDRCTDVFNPNVVRASVGTLFTVPVVETTSEALRPWLTARGVTTVATTPDAPALYTNTDLTGPVAITVGSEQYGLPDHWLEAAGTRVAIPMAGDADSLNAAVATAVVLFEAIRQRGA